MTTTTLFKVKFHDGREYRVFCANKAQKQRFFKTFKFKTFKSAQAFDNVDVSEIINGIHTVKQWEAIAEKM